MARMTSEERSALVKQLRFDHGQAEGGRTEQRGADFHLVPEHLRVLEPEVVLVVGDRGAGKSMLVAAATDVALRKAIVKRTAGLRVATGETEWRTGYPLHAGGPDAAGWEHFTNTHRDDRAVQDLWFAYLARLVRDRLDGEGQSALAGLLGAPGGDSERCFGEFKKAGPAVLLALDRLDESLAAKEEWLFIAYDELDTVLFSDWQAMGSIIRGLVSFWASYARRWKRIRAKIFLRTDFYRHHGDIVGADIAKLAANRVELSWSDKNLYAMLIKRIANKSDDLFGYCQKAGVSFEADDALLKHIPRIFKSEDARHFIERLVGRHMGAGEKKGQSFTWVLDHVRDGNKKASPRSLVRLIEFAAEIEEATPRATGANLLHPTSLRNALDKVSQWHVDQAKRHEFRWLGGVQDRLAADREVPWEGRRELERLLRAKWNDSWSTSGHVRPPADNPRELVDYLVELGIIRARGSDKFDVPDLFLAGLNLRRKGGVRRR